MTQPARPLIRLFVIVALGMAVSRPTAVGGQSVGHCLYECEGSTCADFSNRWDHCLKIRAECQAKCSSLKFWGAIAYSTKDKGAGWSFGWNDLKKAQQEALDRCAKQGTACTLWAWFDNSCGALAASGDIVTWGTAYGKDDADQRALLECRKAGGKNCAIAVSVCSRK